MGSTQNHKIIPDHFKELAIWQALFLSKEYEEGFYNNCVTI